MATKQPQQYYSYAEAALLCRRSPATIMSTVSRHKIPHIRQRHAARKHRIALLSYDALQTLQRLTVLRDQQYGH